MQTNYKFFNLHVAEEQSTLETDINLQETRTTEITSLRFTKRIVDARWIFKQKRRPRSKLIRISKQSGRLHNIRNRIRWLQ